MALSDQLLAVVVAVAPAAGVVLLLWALEAWKRRRIRARYESEETEDSCRRS